MCSFHSGAIFFFSLKQKLSNDALVVSFLSSERISLGRTGSGMMSKMSEIFGKVASATSKSNFGGPAGGEALERASPPTTHYMTRRAFLALRVIHRQGKSSFNMLVKK